MKYYVERETTVARKRVEDAATAIKQEKVDMGIAENRGLTTGEQKKTFEEMMATSGDSLSDLWSSDDEEDGEDEDDEDTELGKLSKDDEPGWVMGTISTMVQQCMERCWQKQMKLDEMAQQGWGDTAYYICGTDMNYGTAKLRVPVVVKLQTDDVAAAPALTTFGELVEYLDIVPGISQILQGTFPQGSIQMRPGSGKARSDKGIAYLAPDMDPNSWSIQTLKSCAPVSYYPCICPPHLITMQKSDSDKGMGTAPALLEAHINNLRFLMSNLSEQQFANQFCYVSALS